MLKLVWFVFLQKGYFRKIRMIV